MHNIWPEMETRGVLDVFCTWNRYLNPSRSIFKRHFLREPENIQLFLADRDRGPRARRPIDKPFGLLVNLGSLNTNPGCTKRSEAFIFVYGRFKIIVQINSDQ